MDGPEALRTERLVLRPLRPVDAEDLRALWAERDPRARRRIGSDGRPTVDDLRQQIQAGADAATRTGLVLLAIERSGEPGFVGYCGLVMGQASKEEPELAYELLRRFHGNGFATEAGRAVVGEADSAGRRRLWATIRDWNVPSRRVAEKVGFRESGRVDEDAERGASIWYVRDHP